LITVLDSDQRRLEGNNGFAGTHIALQQAVHRCGLQHVLGNLFQHSLLRRRGMERQDFFQCFAHTLVHLKRNSRLRAHAAALQFQPKFQEK
jgi:hypothetical protein